MIYAIDTNIISYLLKRDEQVKTQMSSAIDNKYEFVMLPFVYYEVTRWLLERKATKLQAEFKQMCTEMPFVEINKTVWDKAAELYVYSRQIGKPVGGDTDLIIAALCLVNGYTLVTNNTRHFEHIDGLKLVNWKE